jgi:ribonuclease P protein component
MESNKGRATCEPGTVKPHRRRPGDASFPRRARLTKPLEFKTVFQKPVVSSDHCFRILARVNRSGHSRLGMAVSKQVERTAVGRNRIKRIIRESFRTKSRRVHFDCVVLPRRKAATISNSQLFESLDRHWSGIEDRCGDKGKTEQDQ